MKNVKNFANTIVSTVQDKISRVDEVIGDPLLQAAGIKGKDSSKKGKEDSTKKKVSSPNDKPPITWKINKDIYEKIETNRKKQMRKCLQVQNYNYEFEYVQHKNSIINSNTTTLDKPIAENSKLFNNQLDQLTDYELMEVLKKLSMEEKLKLRRVSKRFRNCVNQIIQNEQAFALMDKKGICNFKIEQITSYSIDPIYMDSNELTSCLIQSINKCMNRLTSIVIAYPIEFELFLELIRRRSLLNLVLCGQTFTNRHMNALPDYTVNLISLNLDQCDISDRGLEVIVKECGKVLNIRLSFCSEIIGTFLEHLPVNFQTLELSNCCHFNLDNWSLFLNKDFKQIITFSIENIAFNSNLIEKMMRFDKLSTLKIKFDLSKDYKFKNISMYTRLEILKICDYSNPPCFTDDVFNEIQRGCDRLTKIEFEFDPARIYLTDLSFINISDNCAKLTSIRLINLVNLTDKTLIALSKLKYLLELTLINLKFNDQSLIKTLPDFRSLQKIKIYKCTEITNYLPEQLFKKFFTRHCWYYLSLKSNPKITINKINQTDKPANVIFEHL